MIAHRGGNARVAWPLLLVASACSAAPPERPKQAVATPPAPPSVQVAGPAAAPKVAGPLACTEAPAPTGTDRHRALEVLLSGRPREAADAFERIVRKAPRDLAASVLHGAATATVSRDTSQARATLGRPVVAARLPLARTLVSPLPIDGEGPPLSLVRASESKNLITDDADWFVKNKLAPPVKRPTPTDLPGHVATSAGGVRPTHLFSHADHDVAVYGQVVGAFAPDRTAVLVDFSRSAVTTNGRPLEIDYAQIVGRAVVVQLSINGYARDVVGKTGFVAAFSIDDGSLRWVSAPLVGNAENFLIAGNHVVSGYGFTAEPDHLFVLDLATGDTRQQLKVASGPTWVLAQNGRVLARTYDTDYAFRAEPALAPPPPAGLAPSVSPRAAVGREARCWIDAAIRALDVRDRGLLRTAIRGLDGEAELEPIATAFDGALLFLEKRAGDKNRGVDLTTVEPVVAEPPPWAYAARVPSPPSPPKAPRLVRRKGAAADPVRSLRDRRTRGGAILLPPVAGGQLPAGAKIDVPSVYGLEDLRAVIPSGDRSILVYGGRWLAVVRGAETERVFDLDALRHPPRSNPQWKEFAIQDVTYAQVADGVLYVANGGGSYAKEVFGTKGFMSAFDMASGKLLWRSQPLVVNSTFGLWRDFIVCGYGFTAEPDNLFVLRRADGQIATRTSLESAPSDVTVEGDRVHVEAYGHTYEYDLVP